MTFNDTTPQLVNFSDDQDDDRFSQFSGVASMIDDALDDIRMNLSSPEMHPVPKYVRSPSISPKSRTRFEELYERNTAEFETSFHVRPLHIKKSNSSIGAKAESTFGSSSIPYIDPQCSGKYLPQDLEFSHSRMQTLSATTSESLFTSEPLTEPQHLPLSRVSIHSALQKIYMRLSEIVWYESMNPFPGVDLNHGTNRQMLAHADRYLDAADLDVVTSLARFSFVDSLKPKLVAPGNESSYAEIFKSTGSVSRPFFRGSNKLFRPGAESAEGWSRWLETEVKRIRRRVQDWEAHNQNYPKYRFRHGLGEKKRWASERVNTFDEDERPPKRRCAQKLGRKSGKVADEKMRKRRKLYDIGRSLHGRGRDGTVRMWRLWDEFSWIPEPCFGR
jgi:hypothetical protein